jgi:hypothetical protein
MQWFRTLPCLVRATVGLFMLAQLAGVVSSPLASARVAPTAIAAHVDQRHVHGHSDRECPHHQGERNDNRADFCCALHAFFAGVLPPAIAIASVNTSAQRFIAPESDLGLGADQRRLDRPPRPFAAI